ncbi:MAG: signal peptide peptidase SppA, partial [Bacteroidetes bacterium]
MKKFIGNVMASIIGFFIAMFIVFFVMLGIIGAIADGLEDRDDKVKIKDNSILELKLNYPIIDRTIKNPFKDIDFTSFESKKKLGLNDIIKAIENAKNDEKIKGIYLNVSSLQAGLAAIEEIRNALEDFKKSGKWIVAYSENYSQMAYYLASVADELYVYPEGGISFLGLRTELAFFKGLLDKLDVEVQVIRGRNNKFKSAVEPFMYEHMSDANREQITRFQQSMWKHILGKISESRNIPVERLNLIADSILIQNGYDAVNIKMADKVMYQDEVT